MHITKEKNREKHKITIQQSLRNSLHFNDNDGMHNTARCIYAGRTNSRLSCEGVNNNDTMAIDRHAYQPILSQDKGL